MTVWEYIFATTIMERDKERKDNPKRKKRDTPQSREYKENLKKFFRETI